MWNFFGSASRPKDRYLQVNRVSWTFGVIFIMRTHTMDVWLYGNMMKARGKLRGNMLLERRKG